MRDDQRLESGARHPTVALEGRIRGDLETLTDLPALSPIVVQLTAALGRDDVEVAKVETIIGRDPVVAALVLSAANAAAYASLTPTTSIRGALMRLGLVRVRRLAMLMSVYNTVPVRADLRATYWAHSLAVAHVAESIAQRVDAPDAGPEPDSAFLAGLLHDIGLLVLASHYPKPHDAAKALAARGGLPLWRAERQLLDIDHAEVSGYLARHWSFPEDIAAFIRFHHESHVAPAEHAVGAAIIQVADGAASRLGCDMGERGADADDGPAMARLGLDDTTLTAALDDARLELDQAATVFEAVG